MPADDASFDRLLAEVRSLVSEYRARCLWFLDEGFSPSTRESAERALAYVERYGDRAAFERAVALKQWLSRISSGKSAE